MSINTVNLSEKFNMFDDLWSPKIIGRLNQQLIKVAKFEGEFTRHKHDAEDELFLVIQGRLFIELDTKTLEINAGEFVIIPQGVWHKPHAKELVYVMLFEPASTLNTGGETNRFTMADLDEI